MPCFEYAVFNVFHQYFKFVGHIPIYSIRRLMPENITVNEESILTNLSTW